MADVQKEHGHIQIANQLNWAVIAAPFNEVQRRLVALIISMTFGWGRKTVELSTSEVASMLGVDVTGSFRQSLTQLIREGVIRQLEQGSGTRKSVWMLNKDYERWGRFSLAQAFLVAKWGGRPKHRDELADIGRESTQGASEDAPSSLEGCLSAGTLPIDGHPAYEQAPRPDTGTLPDDRHPARTQARPQIGTLPVHGQVECLHTGTPTGSKSHDVTTYEAGKTGKTVQQQQQLGKEPPQAIAHRRWPELAARFTSRAERDAVQDFLLRSNAQQMGLVPVMINWLDNEMVSGQFKGKVTPVVLAAAVQEYWKGDYSARHVWAFVTGKISQWEQEAGSVREGLGAIAKTSLGAGRRAARIWTLIKRDGLLSAAPEIARQKIDAMQRAGEIRDVEQFLRFLMALPRRDLAFAKTDHYAEDIIGKTLVGAWVDLPEVA